jgi:hypothetical protein
MVSADQSPSRHSRTGGIAKERIPKQTLAAAASGLHAKLHNAVCHPVLNASFCGNYFLDSRLRGNDKTLYFDRKTMHVNSWVILVSTEPIADGNAVGGEAALMRRNFHSDMRRGAIYRARPTAERAQ